MRKFSIPGRYFIVHGRYLCPGVFPARGGWPWNAGNARFPEGPGMRDVECSVPRPLKELKGYDKVYLKKGETKRVRILLDEEAFAYYDVESHRFVVEKGTFEILAGPSSADLPLKATVVL